MADGLGLYILYLWTVYVVFLFIFIVIPAALNVSLGVKRWYTRFLVKVIKYGRSSMESNNVALIEKDVDDSSKSNQIPRNRSLATFTREFKLTDACDFLRGGTEAIIDDDVTKRFTAEELENWNLLMRNNTSKSMGLKVTIIWAIGLFVRYVIFLPVRLTLAIIGVLFIAVTGSLIGLMPENNFRKLLARKSMPIGFRILARGLSAVINFHNRENKAKGGGTCVANHTSPIDAIMLACDGNYSLVGQSQGGLFGFMQKSLSKAQDHIWFERSEMKDRLVVARRLREHVEDSEKDPILIFPEGTCINNTSVMMFKKGSFEIGGIIYPVAIKYDPLFSNAFWNSSQYSLVHYLLDIMSSWALVCDIWYLPPVQRQEGETAIELANRVKADIARQGGLVDLIWDGQLKRSKVKPELRQQKQEDFAQMLKVQ
ncbi:glycerol-3-phosphate acyltransferase 4-like [Xenia sp. Carnegie-2017]|uniref:glycerol-3-phosphate acyltransferase 4-like n=1 Tax=Xenia sp. Carnegie-2017 TaxID=2897299 RepID=UPI001F04A4F8|nr:glycerol-3-phosphate acyltransferase 4-like [Xenia sp. Carnegie-2017]